MSEQVIVDPIGTPTAAAAESVDDSRGGAKMEEQHRARFQGGCVEGGASQPGSFGNCKNLNQHVHVVPDSPMLETASSFGSTSPPPSLANLPPIRVHVEDGMGGGGEVRVQQD
ncbi:leucine-rich repeat extensin-like protein 5 [Sesbania bispinosa]|nr:leucine-rich repeat extensin-like protein 5 [Sesbania bispinosa]